MACQYRDAVLRLDRKEVAPAAAAGRCVELEVRGPVADEALAELLVPLTEVKVLQLERIGHLPRLGHMARLDRVTVVGSPGLTLAESVFAGLGSVERIVVKDTGLAHLPAGAFQGLGRLNYLQMSNSSLTAVRASDFEGLGRLKYLRLSHNRITEVEPGFLRTATGLTGLFLEHNRISDLPAGVFAGPTRIRDLYVGDNHIATIHPDALTGMQARKLNFTRNRVESLPAGVLDGLTAAESVLFASQNPGLKVIPKGLFRSTTEVGWIMLSHNRISKVPRGLLSGLTLLTKLDMENNTLRHIDHRMFHSLTSLKIFHFGTQQPGFTSLPKGLFRGNPGLTSIRFMGNRLTTVPDDLFAGLSNLTRVDFSKNPAFRGFADGAFRDNPKMEKFYLYGTSLSELDPRTLGPLTKVQKLRLENCKITRLASDTFAGWTELTELNLHGNGLTRLAAGTFKDTSRLARLLLAGNLLTALDEDVVGHLEALTTLSLSQRKEGSPGVGCLPLASFGSAAEQLATSWAKRCFRGDPGMKACLEREWAGPRWEALLAVERESKEGERYVWCTTAEELTGGTELGRGEGWVLEDGAAWDWKGRRRVRPGGSDGGFAWEPDRGFTALLCALLLLLAVLGFRALRRQRGRPKVPGSARSL